MFFCNYTNNSHDAENNMKDTPEDHHEGVAARFPHHYLHHQQQQYHYHQLQQPRRELSDEVDSSRSSGGDGLIKKPRPDNSSEYKSSKDMALVVFGGKAGGESGATADVAKRPRGRPPGSKNKPKPPVVITREADPTTAMRPHVLEIPGGHDVVDSLVRFCRHRNLGICVLAGTGAVANVALRQPSIVGAQGGAHKPTPPPSGAAPVAIGFHGRFEILSMSAMFLPSNMAAVSPAASGTLSISLAGPQGHIVGGTVAGPLMTAGTVVVVAAAFSNPTFHRLPAEDDLSVPVSVKAGDGADMEGSDQQSYHHHQAQQQQQQQQHRHRAKAEVTGATAAESCGIRTYNGHLPTEVMWPPTAHPPPPY